MLTLQFHEAGSNEMSEEGGGASHAHSTLRQVRRALGKALDVSDCSLDTQSKIADLLARGSQAVRSRTPVHQPEI